MNGKVAMSISIGLTALVFVAIMFTQFKTVEQTDIMAIETMRETELRTEIASWKSKYDEMQTKIEETEILIEEYQNTINNNKDANEALKIEKAKTDLQLGYTTVQGEGIVIKLEDTEEKTITTKDFMLLVNYLREAGAEAISINEERIVNTTEIANINQRFILVNDRKIESPYEVKVIGNQKYLESALTIKNGFYDAMISSEKKVSYEPSNKILIPAFDGEIEITYAENVD